MSKPAKPAAAPAAGDQPPKSKKMLIIIIAVVVLLAGGGAAFFMMKKDHPPKGEHAAASEEAPADDGEDESKPKVPPKFVEIGTFTANLMKEGDDRVMQVAITLKLSKPELEEKVKESNPEIQHRVNMLLQSKYPSELATVAGKEKLAGDIKSQVEYVLGLRKSAPEIHATAPAAEGETPHAATAETPSKKGVAEVLFTSFIIQ
ncbi:MAG: flagellar basal body-associated FliL family protein [Proteobacteria bacterium]|nr:flagellar basal body-associated FliL family protein [Pseudomonadota bacterium]